MMFRNVNGISDDDTINRAVRVITEITTKMMVINAASPKRWERILLKKRFII
jgi:hypothetical protein